MEIDQGKGGGGQPPGGPSNLPEEFDWREFTGGN